MCGPDCAGVSGSTSFSLTPSKSIFHVRVGTDSFGNPPTAEELEAIKTKFETAIASGDDAVIVTSDRVEVVEYRV